MFRKEQAVQVPGNGYLLGLNRMLRNIDCCHGNRRPNQYSNQFFYYICTIPKIPNSPRNIGLHTSKFVFMDYGCDLFDVIIAYFVAIFVSIKRKILEVQFLSSSLIRPRCSKWYAVPTLLSFTTWCTVTFSLHTGTSHKLLVLNKLHYPVLATVYIVG